MLKKIRRILAAVMFIAITLLFLDFTGTLHHYLSWLAHIQFLPALLALHVGIVIVLLLLTLIFGRIYCSVICPLGVMQDGFAWLGRRKMLGGKKNPYRYSKAISWLRYSMLVLLVLSVFLGVNSVVALLAPYSSYGRIATTLLQPVYIYGNNLLAMIAEHYDSYAFYEREVWIRSIPTLVIAAISLVLIIILSWRNGRTYCNTICPVGTVLGFFARFSWLKVYFVEDKCIKCGKCARNCKAACIDFKNVNIDYSRCVTCGDCIEKCDRSALVYAHPSKKESPFGKKTDSESKKNGIAKEQINPGRRSFLLGATIATTTSILAQEKKKVDGGLAVIEDKIAPERATTIVPPGALSAQNLASHCTGCQLCVSECPNDVLRPATGLTNLMQPYSSYERGYCRPECTRCSDVCPAGAIRPITKAEKSAIQIGHAVWVKKNCIPVTDGMECGNCARHCPTGAIIMVELHDENAKPKTDVTEGTQGEEVPKKVLKIPAVNTARCIGCGACENLCPARPFSAIYVEGHEMHRII